MGSFGLIGIVGFAIDAGVLLWLTGDGLNAYAARVCSFLCAASTTWYLNRRFTFRPDAGAGGVGREWVRYLAVSLIGGTLNYATYAIVLTLSPAQGPLVSVLGVAAGSITGMLSNFTLSRLVVFRIPTIRSEAP